jgi:hypothetical protein
MSTFKTQAEVWQALLDGKEIKYGKCVFKMIDGQLQGKRIGDPDIAYDKSALAFICYEEVELYTPPKKKIKMAPALLRFADGEYHITPRLFSSAQDAVGVHGSCFHSWLIDTHAIEVEV